MKWLRAGSEKAEKVSQSLPRLILTAFFFGYIIVNLKVDLK